MALLNGNDLLQAGWPPGPHFAQMLRAVAEMEARGIQDQEYALKLLRRDFPPPPPKRGMREVNDTPALAEAIEATSPVDEQNIGAVRRLMGQLLRVPVIQRGAVMPDACPAGVAEATIPVGGAIAVDHAIIPGAHSADICCSMHATFYRTAVPIESQLDVLMSSTRFGQGGRQEEDWVRHVVLDEPVWNNPFLAGLERHAAMHLADQGDGNHFAYLGEVDFTAAQIEMLRVSGHVELAEAMGSASRGRSRWNVLVTHHGSRGLGAQVYKRGQKAAEKHTAKIAEKIPAAACWLDFDTEDGAAYWEALQYVGRWTRANHECIHAGFLEKLGARASAAIGNEHNFVWKRGRTFYHGKGATPAWKDERGRPQLGLIPMNMAAPILLVMGRDNDEFLSFAPHGAGRNVSRAAVMRPFRLKDGGLDEDAVRRVIIEHTSGISLRWWHGKPDLSETPIGYKSAAQVRAQIERFGLADIVAEIRPLGCIMAGDAGPRPWEREKDLTPKQKRQIEHRADRRKSRQELLRWDRDADADADS